MITIDDILIQHINVHLIDKLRSKISDKLDIQILEISGNETWNQVRDQLYFQIKRNINI